MTQTGDAPDQRGEAGEQDEPTAAQPEHPGDPERPTGTEHPGDTQLAAAQGFVTRHGSPARAVVQPIGRSGARVVLVGADGALGDVLVASNELGEALIDAVDGLERATWDAETVAATGIGPEHRRRMGRSPTRR